MCARRAPGWGKKNEFRMMLLHVPSSSLADSETALADLALDVLRLVLVDHWSWLCTENIQKVFNLLFGTLVQR